MNDSQSTKTKRLRSRKFTILAVAILSLAIAGTALAGSSDDDATDRPIPTSALSKASAAAIESTGGGKVTQTEIGDEDGYYEVEVTLADGSAVDVHLDNEFKLIGSVADDDSTEESGK